MSFPSPRPRHRTAVAADSATDDEIKGTGSGRWEWFTKDTGIGLVLYGVLKDSSVSSHCITSENLSFPLQGVADSLGPTPEMTLDRQEQYPFFPACSDRDALTRSAWRAGTRTGAWTSMYML